MFLSLRLILVLGIGACSAACGRFFTLGPRPSELAGTWVDSAKTTQTDSSLWILAPNGADRVLHITVSPRVNTSPRVESHETRRGSWYMSGALADASKRALCFKRRARDGPSCMRFRLDTVIKNGSRRRLVLLGDRRERQTSEQVFVERVPQWGPIRE